MNISQLIFVGSILLTATSAKGAAADNCPSAPERPLSIWRWSTIREFKAVVWSNDGTELLVSEQALEAKAPAPWSPYGDQRKSCFRLVAYSPAGQKLRNITEFQPGWIIAEPDALAHMGAYQLIQIQNPLAQNRFEMLRISADGHTKVIASSSCGGVSLIPSPTGDTLAFMKSLENCQGASSPMQGSNFAVSFFDAEGKSVGPAKTVHFTDWAVGTWTEAGSFVISDGREAYAVDSAGQVQNAPLPQCTHPATTSSVSLPTVVSLA